jgi:putative hydrolase of HD superfamily
VAQNKANIKQPDIRRLIEFQQMLLSFSHIERRLKRKHLDDVFVRENDTEHSYNLAMTAWFLTEYFPELDQDLAIKLAMVHDLVEIYAGDTYVYADTSILATKESREKAALARLKSEWADFKAMTHLIEEYEHRRTPEAKFVYALDKIMPIMQIYINEGKTWQEEGITVAKLHHYKENKIALSPEIQPYYDQLRAILLNSPHLIPAE